ncbi:hypothetical protein ACFQVA_21640 [Actinomadura keratinilytica]
MIGLFINTVPVRARVEPAPSGSGCAASRPNSWSPARTSTRHSPASSR